MAPLRTIDHPCTLIRGKKLVTRAKPCQSQRLNVFAEVDKSFILFYYPGTGNINMPQTTPGDIPCQIRHFSLSSFGSVICSTLVKKMEVLELWETIRNFINHTQ